MEYFISLQCLRLEEVKIFSARSPESPKEYSIFAECVPERSGFEFELQVDRIILDDFASLNQRTSFGLNFSQVAEVISKPLDAASEMSKDLYDLEKRFFEVELNLPQAIRFSSTPNFRLGWGAGLLGTSMAMLLPENLRQEFGIRSLMSEATPRRRSQDAP